MKKNLNQLVLLLIIFSSIFFSSGNKRVTVQASAVKVDICHAAGKDGTLKYETINVAEEALSGHFYENGTSRAGHENDHFGVCTCDELMNCPTNVPTLPPVPVDCEYHWSDCSESCGWGVKTLIIDKEPENGGKACPTWTTKRCFNRCCPTVTLTPTLTPEVTATPTEIPEVTGTPEVTETPSPTINPTPTPTNPPSIGGGNPPGPPVCTDPKPGTPTNLTATWVGSEQVRLNWTPAAEPHTSYVLAYGPSTSDYRWGSPNIGNGTEYTVGSLTPGAQYCFYIYAQNNCMPGDRSNEVCVNQGSTIRAANVLGATDNHNPLVSGIKDSYGGMVLGETSEMPQTAEVKYSAEKLPSGNTLDANHSIAIPSLNLAENVYIPQKIGDEFVVGHQEVLYEQINGNEVYYGHNGSDVFGNLYRLNTGEKVEVAEDGVSKTYLIEEKLFVHKSQIDSLETGDNQIVLTTCSYTQPDFRIVIKATLIK